MTPLTAPDDQVRDRREKTMGRPNSAKKTLREEIKKRAGGKDITKFFWKVIENATLETHVVVPDAKETLKNSNREEKEGEEGESRSLHAIPNTRGDPASL